MFLWKNSFFFKCLNFKNTILSKFILNFSQRNKCRWFYKLVMKTIMAMMKWDDKGAKERFWARKRMFLAFIKRKRAFNGLNFMNLILLGRDKIVISYFTLTLYSWNEICKVLRKWEIGIVLLLSFWCDLWFIGVLEHFLDEFLWFQKLNSQFFPTFQDRPYPQNPPFILHKKH